MSIQIAIPSYQRAETLKTKTLSVLKGAGIPANRITIFVADHSELDIYSRAVKGYRLEVGKPTLKAQRNFITQFYDEGQPVVHIDDDIEEIGSVQNGKLVPIKHLDQCIEEGFSACAEYKCRLWGVYPVYNAFFMKSAPVTCDLRYIVGAFWGCINTQAVQVSLEDKEDFERTILFYLRDKGVVRLNRYAIKTNYYTEPGGMQVTRSAKRVTDSALFLLRKYPELCTLKKSHRGMTEITLKDRRK